MTSRPRGLLLAFFLLFASYFVDARGEPPLSVRVQPDQEIYLLGEPVRLRVTVKNLSDQTLVISRTGRYRVTPPRKGTTEREDRALSDPSITLAPFDSSLYFLYPNCTVISRDESGVWPWCPDFHTFRTVGRYRIRVGCDARVQKALGVIQASDDWLPATWSNEIRLEMRKPRTRERQICDALWHSGAVGYGANNLELLRAVRDRFPNSPQIVYIDYAIARMLIGRAEFPRDERSDIWEGSRILSDYVADQHPTFRPEEVAYYRAFAELRSDQAGVNPYGAERAKQIMTTLVSAHPELRAHPEISVLAERIMETGEELEVRLRLDKRTFVVGEPILFRVVIANRSTRTIRAVGPGYLTPHATSFACFVEIERPDGVRELRTTNNSIAQGVSTGGVVETGVPLAPGDSIASPCTYHLTGAAVERFAYRSPTPANFYAFAKPGHYRVSAAYGPPDLLWTLGGAGHLLLSKSVDIEVLQPDRQESSLLESLRTATKESVFRETTTSPDGVDTLRQAIQKHPQHPLAFYLKRSLAQSYRYGHGDPDWSQTLSLLSELENEAHGLRKQEIQIQLLYAYRDIQQRKIQTASNVNDAFLLIDRMTAADPSLWTNANFCYAACNLRLGGSQDYRWVYATNWWFLKMRRDGPTPPSWGEMKAIADMAPARREPMGPFQPRAKGRHPPHFLR